jgi:hypothetical protein
MASAMGRAVLDRSASAVGWGIETVKRAFLPKEPTTSLVFRSRKQGLPRFVTACARMYQR